MRDKLSKSLGVDKALLAEQDDITIAKLYCLQYVADQTAYSAFLKGINKKDLTVNMHSRGTLNINIYLDEQIYSGEYLAEKEITRRFKDENRTGYLDNKSDLLLADALKTIGSGKPHIAEKIVTTLTYINNLKNLNEILDRILKNNNLDYSGNSRDIEEKIKKMKNAFNVRVEKSEHEALLVLGEDLAKQLQEKFTIVPSRVQLPAQPVGFSIPASSGARVSSPAKATSGQSSSPVVDNAKGPELLAPFGGDSVPKKPWGFRSAGASGGAEEAQIEPNSIKAIKQIAACIGVKIEGNKGGLLEEFVSKILEGRYEIKGGSQEAYKKALDVLRNDKNCGYVVDLLGQSFHSQAGAASNAKVTVTSSRAPLFGAKQASSSPQTKIPSTDGIKKRIRDYVSELSQLGVMGGENFGGRLIKFLNEAKDNIDQDPQLLKRLDLFFQSVDKIGGGIVLAYATESKNINSKHVLEKGGKKVNLGVDCIEFRLMHEASSKTFSYVIGAKNINLQTEVEGNYVLVDPNDRSANESYAPYAVPDDNGFLKHPTQQKLFRLNLLDGISQMAQAISNGKTDIRVTCVEGKGRSVTLALLFAKICKGDYSLNEINDKALIEKLARDRNSDYNYVTTGSHQCNDYQNSDKFKMLTDVLGEFGKELGGKTAIESIKQVADDMIQKIQGELTTPSAKSIVSRYANQPEMKRAPVIGP